MDLRALFEALGLDRIDEAELRALIVLGIISIWADRIVLFVARVIRYLTPVTLRACRRLGIVAEKKVEGVVLRAAPPADRPKHHMAHPHHSAKALALEAARIAATGAAAIELLIEPTSEEGEEVAM